MTDTKTNKKMKTDIEIARECKMKKSPKSPRNSESTRIAWNITENTRRK